MDRFLTLLGLALRAKKLAVGEDPVYDSLLRGRARAVFLAADASEHTVRKLKNKAGETPLYPISAGKEEVGRALGRKSCALAAITDPGFAQRLVSLVEPQDGGVTI